MLEIGLTALASEGTKAAVTEVVKKVGGILVAAAGAYLATRAKESAKRVETAKAAQDSFAMDFAQGAMDVGLACVKEFLVGGIRYYWKEKERKTNRTATEPNRTAA